MGVLGCLLFLAMALKLQHVPLGDPVSGVEEVLRAGDVQARILRVVATVPANRLGEVGREQLPRDLRDEVGGRRPVERLAVLAHDRAVDREPEVLASFVAVSSGLATTTVTSMSLRPYS
jgi:hypothetical protein